jgi:hypothetical protein
MRQESEGARLYVIQLILIIVRSRDLSLLIVAWLRGKALAPEYPHPDQSINYNPP